MKSDPRVELFNNKKIIKKGCILQSKYIIGVVLYTSKLCFPAMTRKTTLVTKYSRVDIKIRELSIVMIVADIIISIFGSLLYRRIKSLQFNSTAFTYTRFVSQLSLYLSVMPLTLNILMELFHAISALILQRYYRGLTDKRIYETLVPKRSFRGTVGLGVSTFMKGDENSFHERNSFEVLNPNVLADLGDVDDAFFDKTGTLTTTSYDVKTIATRSKIYKTRTHNFSCNKLMRERTIFRENEFSESFAMDDVPGEGKTSINFNEEMILPFKSIPAVSERKISSPKRLILPLEESPLHKLNLTQQKLPSPEQNILKREKSLKSKLIEKYIAPEKHTGDSPKKSGNNIANGSLTPERKPSVELNKITEDMVATEEEFFQDWIQGTEIKSLLNIFALCHNAVVNGKDYDTNFIEEKTLLKLAQEYNTEFIYSEQNDADLSDSKHSIYYIQGPARLPIKIEVYFRLFEESKIT